MFASDMHLSQARPDTAAAFLRALDEGIGAARHLFLLGDLLDAWVGDDRLDAPPADTVVGSLVDWLRAASARGVAIYLQHGNRDFLIGPAFAARCGATLLPDPVVVDLHGTPVLLTHGDALCTDDTAYQAVRAQVRAADWQTRFLAQPLNDRLAQARHMRERSEDAKRELDLAWMDATEPAVHEALQRAGARVMIHGHTHRPAHHRVALPAGTAQRWVLPDWEGGQRGGLLRARRGWLEPVGAWPAPAPVAAALADAR